jgi:hypothetical protein
MKIKYRQTSRMALNGTNVREEFAAEMFCSGNLIMSADALASDAKRHAELSWSGPKGRRWSVVMSSEEARALASRLLAVAEQNEQNDARDIGSRKSRAASN